MGKQADIELLMDSWKEKHRNKGYKRFIRDGIVCEEQWEKLAVYGIYRIQ